MRTTFNYKPARKNAVTRRKSRGFTLGFTLVELLLVIAIISILTAILFAVFGKARNRSAESVCMSQMRQIGMALRMYQQDYDGNLPFKFKMLGDGYIKSKEILRCPSFLQVAKLWPAEGQRVALQEFSSYFYKPEHAHWLVHEFPREAGDPAGLYLTWEEAYELRGEALPLLECKYHDPFVQMNKEKEGIFQQGDIRHLILRLDGSVGFPIYKSRPKFWYER